MAILKPDKITKVSIGEETLTIKEKIIPDNAVASKHVAVWCKKGWKMKPCKKLNDETGKPLGITVHNTPDIKVASNTTPAEQYTRATYPNCNMSGVVVHFYVYKTDIWQNLKLNERGWHATDGTSRRDGQRKGLKIGGNIDTIAIEAIGKDPETEKTTAKLVAYLCKEFELDPSIDVYQHNYFYPSKNCPEYIRPHWSQFIDKCETYYKAATEPTKPTTKPITTKPAASTTKPSTSSNKSFLVKIICNSLNVRKSATVLSKKVTVVKKNEVFTIVETNKAGTWGKLKSGIGWINITSKYVKRV